MSYCYDPNVMYRSREHTIAEITDTFHCVKDNFFYACRYARVIEDNADLFSNTPYLRYMNIQYVAPGTTTADAVASHYYGEGDAALFVLCEGDTRLAAGQNFKRCEDTTVPVYLMRKSYYNGNLNNMKMFLVWVLRTQLNYVWYGNYINQETGLYDVTTMSNEVDELRAQQEARERAEREARERAEAQDIINNLAQAKFVPDTRVLERAVDEAINKISTAERAYFDAMRALRDAQSTDGAGVGVSIGQALQPYLSKIRNTRLRTDSNNRFVYLDINYRTPMTIWEDDEVDSVIRYMRNYYEGRELTEARQQALTIFEKMMHREVTYISEQAIRITRDYPARVDTWTTRNYHPHVGGFNCWGNNAELFTSYWNAGNFDLAFAVVNNTLSQLNLTDYCVCRKMVDLIYASLTWSETKCWLYNDQVISGRQLRKELFNE